MTAPSRTSSSSTTGRATSTPPPRRSSAPAPTSTLTSDKQAALEADGLLVPGVGAFAAVIDQLEGVQGGEIVDHRLAGGRPVLGICVGMQVLFSRGIERGADVEGLGQWPGTVEQLQAEVLPHMGWNTVQAPEDSVLFDGLHDERFYFVHSYGVTDFPLEAYGPFRAPRLTWAEHGQRVHRRGRERPAHRHAVPPREVRRAGHPPALQLGALALNPAGAGRDGRRRTRPGLPVRPPPLLHRDETDRTMTDLTDTPPLVLLPAVDVVDGQAVRLTQGEAGSETGYGDPVAAARDLA